VNFLFVIVWLAFSLRLFGGKRPRPGLEKCVVGFTGGIMFFAAVVFASQIVAWTSTALFLMIGMLALWKWWHPNGIRE
jgi:CDP-diglyceride synthetase